jgi:hypothetical protein
MLYEAVILDPSKQPYHEVLYRWLHPNGGPGLQTINAPGLGLVDAKMDEQVARDARRRTAMIEFGGRPAGSGLLVGPDFLLTAAHLVNEGSLWFRLRLSKTFVTSGFRFRIPRVSSCRPSVFPTNSKLGSEA